MSFLVAWIFFFFFFVEFFVFFFLFSLLIFLSAPTRPNTTRHNPTPHNTEKLTAAEKAKFHEDMLKEQETAALSDSGKQCNRRKRA